MGKRTCMRFDKSCHGMRTRLLYHTTGLERYKRVTTFVGVAKGTVFTFYLAPFRNRAQIVTAKVKFSNNFAPAYM